MPTPVIYRSDGKPCARPLIEKGQIEPARLLEQPAKGLLRPGQRDADSLDKFCRLGALIGDAAAVLDFCNLSVQMAGELEPRGLYRESRAIARALTGDLGGAAEDLRYVTLHPYEAWARIWYDGQTDAAATQRRGEWLAQLQAGVNPFNPSILRTLLQEAAAVQ